MNILYESVYSASLLPWTIICLFYFVRVYILLSDDIYPFGDASYGYISLPYKLTMVEINRLLHIQRLLVVSVCLSKSVESTCVVSCCFSMSRYQCKIS